MIKVNGYYYDATCICFHYECDICGGICGEMHEKENDFLFYCKVCRINYILPKKLNCTKVLKGGV